MTGVAALATFIVGDVNFTFTRFTGITAAVVWTLGWVRIAILTAQHPLATNSTGAAARGIVSVIGVAVGCWLMFRSYPRGPDINTNKPSPPEPWYRHVTGSVATMVWCAVAAIWNFSIYAVLVQSAIRGQTANFFLLIPFEIIALFLLLLLFTCVGVVLDFIFRLEKGTTPNVPAGPFKAVAPPQPAQSPNGISLNGKPILAILFFTVFINWFVFFGLSMHWGGDAIGISPSKEGFVLKDHGRRTPVSESVWVFSLYYDTATLLGSPAIIIPIALWQLREKRKTAKWPMQLFVGLFLVVWITGWFGGIGSDFLRSYADWQKVKNGSLSLPQLPNTRTNMSQ
jgi:hypothetical protein